MFLPLNYEYGKQYGLLKKINYIIYKLYNHVINVLTLNLLNFFNSVNALRWLSLAIKTICFLLGGYKLGAGRICITLYILVVPFSHKQGCFKHKIFVFLGCDLKNISKGTK